MTASVLTLAGQLARQIAALPCNSVEQQMAAEETAASVLDLLVDALRETDAAIEIEQAAARIRANVVDMRERFPELASWDRADAMYQRRIDDALTMGVA